MAGKKRKSKQAAGRKGRKKPAPKRQSRLIRWAALLLLLGLVSLLTAGALYLFGSLEKRTAMENSAREALYQARTASWVPAAPALWLARMEDRLPGGHGLTVDPGELPLDEPHALAGLPQAGRALQLLRNATFVLLFDPEERQPVVLSARFSRETIGNREAAQPDGRYEDPRVAAPALDELRSGPWLDGPLAPLGPGHGPAAVRETRLSSALVPMRPEFAERVWEPLLKTLSQQFPQRFDEIWLHLGPVYAEPPSRTAAGVPIPDAFFVIALDLTPAGGLRSLSFLVPADARSFDAADQLCTIDQIEAATGLRFLPKLEPFARKTLTRHAADRSW